MKKSAVYVLLLAILLVFSIVLCIVRLIPGKEDKQGDTSQPPVSQTSSSPAQSSPDASPEQSPDGETQTQEPDSSDEPQSTPESGGGETLASGSFSSNTGTDLNLFINWTAQSAGEGKVTLRVDVSTTSYSFQTDALPYSIVVDIGGNPVTVDSAAVNYDGETIAVSPLASYQTELSTGQTVDITVRWNYRGSYGGTELETITASGSASF